MYLQYLSTVTFTGLLERMFWRKNKAPQRKALLIYSLRRLHRIVNENFLFYILVLLDFFYNSKQFAESNSFD